MFQPLPGSAVFNVVPCKEPSGTLVMLHSCCSGKDKSLPFLMWLQEVSPLVQNHFGPFADQGYTL